MPLDSEAYETALAAYIEARIAAALAPDCLACMAEWLNARVEYRLALNAYTRELLKAEPV